MMPKPRTPVTERTPEAQAIALRTALNPDIINPATQANAAEFIVWAGEGIGATTSVNDLKIAAGLQFSLRDANTPRPRGPFFRK
jgi:hypothetical protein